MLYQHITELIGNTPLLRLDPARHGIEGVDLYAKLEYYNPFGSVKDRIAWGMLREDLAEITRRGQTLIEASSGNTAKALQVLAAMHGLRLRTLTNRTKVAEVRDLLELLGVELEELPGLSECPDPTVPDDVFSTIEKMMTERPGEFYHTSQYTNLANVRTHHDTTGQEIAEDLGEVDYLFGGLGTTGSTRGAATFLRAANPAAEDDRRGVHQGRLHPRHPLRGRAVGGRPVRARLLRPDHAGPPGRRDRRHAGTGGPARRAGRPHHRRHLLGGAAVPAAAAGAREPAAPRGHHRLRPAGTIPVVFPQAPPGLVRAGTARHPGRRPGRRRDGHARAFGQHAGRDGPRPGAAVRRHPRQHGIPDRPPARFGEHPR